eukprot:gnl/Dysnectes_brevis/7162_a11744_392.p1 GENE.gnl/Dysnectes_brevis/7162_a11744_392~~gnl/Dysnectes_brevis/7162_a11744_392.p1  ORF type:complete len:450 (-),score=40.31 gnl/Dysnectes_brevis/7162_a11744_392:42-1391(-)
MDEDEASYAIKKPAETFSSMYYVDDGLSSQYPYYEPAFKDRTNLHHFSHPYEQDDACRRYISQLLLPNDTTSSLKTNIQQLSVFEALVSESLLKRTGADTRMASVLPFAANVLARKGILQSYALEKSDRILALEKEALVSSTEAVKARKIALRAFSMSAQVPNVIEHVLCHGDYCSSTIWQQRMPLHHVDTKASSELLGNREIVKDGSEVVISISLFSPRDYAHLIVGSLFDPEPSVSVQAAETFRSLALTEYGKRLLISSGTAPDAVKAAFVVSNGVLTPLLEGLTCLFEEPVVVLPMSDAGVTDLVHRAIDSPARHAALRLGALVAEVDGLREPLAKDDFILKLCSLLPELDDKLAVICGHIMEFLVGHYSIAQQLYPSVSALIDQVRERPFLAGVLRAASIYPLTAKAVVEAMATLPAAARWGVQPLPTADLRPECLIGHGFEILK